jgi:hypothetical protein
MTKKAPNLQEIRKICPKIAKYAQKQPNKSAKPLVEAQHSGHLWEPFGAPYFVTT